MCRSCVKVEGKDSSATLQPFYTLQLDIQVVNHADNYCSSTRAHANLFSQDSSIDSVTDALLANFASEQLDG